MTKLLPRPASAAAFRRAAGVGLALVAAGALPGCGSVQQGLGSLIPQTATVAAPAQSGPAATLTTGSTTPVPANDAAHGAGNVHLVVSGSRLGVYERIARQALTCWLGGEGPLKGSHVFGAEVPPESGDGQPKGITEIGIYQRDPTQPAARGLRAYRIAFDAYGEGQTVVDAANSKISADIAGAMGRDVEAWARGGDGCIARSVMPPKPQAAQPAPPPAKKTSSKAKKPATPRKAG